MKKVLLISEPGNDGVKSHVIDLLSKISKEKFKLTYIYSLYRYDSIYLDQIKELEKKNVECVRIDINSGLSVSDLSAIYNIYKFLKRRKFDVIHCHSGKAGLVGRIATMLAGKESIIYTPNAFPFQNNSSRTKTFFYKYAEKFLSIITQKIICVSKSEYEEAIKVGIKKNRLVLIENGVNTDKFNYLEKESVFKIKEELNLPTQKLLILSVGRMEFQKNPIFLYESILEYSKKYGRNIHFIHIGKGELKNEVENFIVENKINDLVTIIEYTNKVHLYLKACDVFLLLSRYEGLSIALLEAMACGSAIIGTDVVGIKDVVKDGKSGFLVQNDPLEVAERIYYLKENVNELNMMKKFNHALIKKEYSTERMVSEVESVYLKIS